MSNIKSTLINHPELMNQKILYNLLLCETRCSPKEADNELLLKCCKIVEESKEEFICNDKACSTIICCYTDRGLLHEARRIVDKVLPQLSNKRTLTAKRILNYSLKINELMPMVKKFYELGYKFPPKVYDYIINRLLKSDQKELATNLIDYLNSNGYKMTRDDKYYYKKNNKSL